MQAIADGGVDAGGDGGVPAFGRAESPVLQNPPPRVVAEAGVSVALYIHGGGDTPGIETDVEPEFAFQPSFSH